MKFPRTAWVVRSLATFTLTALPIMTQTSGSNFANFEGALTNPIRLSADGTRLYCVNNPNATVSIFDLSNPVSPVLIKEVPVGLEPVSVNPRTNDEVWVVNQESDSVSVLSVSSGIVTDTIKVADEPSDVVFAGNYAFVSAARSNTVYAIDVGTHAIAKSIPLFGGSPRAMAVSADGSTVYTSFALSGNGTTTIPFRKAPPPPPPINPALPPAPQQTIIVSWNDPAWKSQIGFTMPDNDVAAISVANLSINRYYSGVGTLNLGIAVQPSTGNLFVTNTDALNLVRFQTNLNGHFINNRISKITPSGTVTAYDLNPTVSYTGLPDSASRAVAISQPTGIVFDATGNAMYVASFGTDRVAHVDTSGNVLDRIEINPQAQGSTVNSSTMRGPRGLAINNLTSKLYVLNRISNTFSIIDTTTDAVVAFDLRTGTKDPTPAAIKQGRGFLYDAKLSGNGTGSCAACHLDGEMDHMDWDLGDPTGTMFPVPLKDGTMFDLHPMKGAMVTQTLRGLLNTAPYHWRGDRLAFSNFNEAFQVLMGGNQLSDSDMTTYTNFVNTILYMPNPYQNLDRSLPTSLNGGNAVNGQTEFQTIILNQNQDNCNVCHLLPIGSTLLRNKMSAGPQAFKAAQLRGVYEKQLYSVRASQNIDGVGMSNDGIEGTLQEFLGNPIEFPGLKGNTQAVNDISAFVNAFDTGMAPSVGYTRTITSANQTSAAPDWQTLEARSVAGDCDLVVDGLLNSKVVSLQYSPSSATYTSPLPGVGPYTHKQLAYYVQQGAVLSVMGVAPGTGSTLVGR